MVGNNVRTPVDLLILMALAILSCPTHALAYLSDGTNIPADQWEMHSDAGIACAMSLMSEDRPNGGIAYFLAVQLKNISTSPKGFGWITPDDGFSYFYIDSIYRRDLHQIPPNVKIDMGKNAGTIDPGKIFVEKTELSDADLLFISNQSIQCDFRINDPASSKYYDIITSPQKTGGPFFIEKHDMDSRGSHATLSMDNPVIKLGELFRVDTCFYNSDSSQDFFFFNPFFNQLLSLPAQLAVFDNKKKYVGDLLAFAGGSQAGLGPQDWISIPQSGYLVAP